MANELSDRQIEELKSAFGLFDYESGTVEVRELPNLLKTIGLAPNLEELKTLEQVLKTIRDRCYDFGTIFAIKIGTRNAGLPMYRTAGYQNNCQYLVANWCNFSSKIVIITLTPRTPKELLSGVNAIIMSKLYNLRMFYFVELTSLL
jgi:hypothetical protein